MSTPGNEHMNLTSCAGSPQYAPAPCKLTFDLLTFKVVSESRVTWTTYLCANFSLPRPLCSQLRPDVRDTQTSHRRQTWEIRSVPDLSGTYTLPD